MQPKCLASSIRCSVVGFSRNRYVYFTPTLLCSIKPSDFETLFRKIFADGVFVLLSPASTSGRSASRERNFLVVL